MTTCRVIFWDVYGTLLAAHRGDLDSLVRREKELRAAFEKTIWQFHLKLPAEQLHRDWLNAIFTRRQAKLAAGLAHPEIRIEDIWQSLVPGGPAREVAAFFERHANPKRLQPDAVHTLTRLHDRSLWQGIISNAQFYTPLELAELLRVEGADFETIFDPKLLFLSCDLGVAKPDPTAFQGALAAVAAAGIGPAECLMVGDSPDNDIAPAQQAGMRAVLFAPTLPSEPGVRIQRLPELLEWR